MFIDAIAEAEDGEDGEAEMRPKDASLYRAVTARINFLALDRADIKFASKDVGAASNMLVLPLAPPWQKARLSKLLFRLDFQTARFSSSHSV